MANQPLLNRRFVRIQAMQQLYAFSICKQANYEGALAKIKTTFTPDIFADAPVDPVQLAQEAQQAQDLFKATLTNDVSFDHTNSRVNKAVDETLVSYKNELTKDTRRLEQGFSDAVALINKACARIWQLLVEWTHLAKKQSEKPRLSAFSPSTSTVYLSSSTLLQCLQEEHNLVDLVQQEQAGWDAYMPLVEDWYHQFVRKDPSVIGYLADSTQEKGLLTFLIDKIIFHQEAIQAFFEEKDLNWTVHKRLVKKLIYQGLASFEQDSEKGFTLKTCGVIDHWEEPQLFYTDLVKRTLQHDEELETLMAQKSDNWTADRIMLLDKTIIKLALCEMLYFSSIPVKVSMNEYIDLAKTYSISKSSQFVNGVLDAVASELHERDATKKI